MSVLDVFSNDAFGMVSLTASINKLPYIPSRIGQMNLFQEKNITTCHAMIEERHGHLMLLPTAARGSMKTYNKQPKQVARAFCVPHIPKNDTVLADDLCGIRRWGTESQLQSVAQEVNERLARIVQEHELTWEWHRLGAIKGIVYDSDGTTVLHNWYKCFGIAESVVEIDLSADGCPVKKAAHAIRRKIEDNLGMTPYRSLHALVGSEFMDKLSCDSEEFCKAWERYQDGRMFRESQARGAFEYGGIVWEEYRGSIGGKDFIEPDCGHIFPVGVPGLFCRINAPGTFIESVNTRARRMYVKQARDKWDTCVELHTQSNPLFMCTRPGALCKVKCVGGTAEAPKEGENKLAV